MVTSLAVCGEICYNINMGEIEIIYALQGAGEGWITFFKIFTLFGSWLGFAVALMPLFFKDRKL